MSLDLLRLTWLGSGQAWGRLAAIVGGVAVGTALLLLLTGAFLGLNARDQRTAWYQPFGEDLAERDRPDSPLMIDEVLVNARHEDFFEDRSITRLDLAATAGSTVSVPGIGAPPASGTYYASPALATLIDQTPPALLGDRYGTRAGLLPAAVLTGPDALVVVTGQPEATLREQSWTMVATELAGEARGSGLAYQIVIIIGAIGLLFPVLLFVSIVTQLGAAARREQFATLRLIGAGPAVISQLIVVETVVTSLAGALLGVVLAAVARPLAARFPVQGTSFYPADLAVSLPLTLGAAIIMIVLAAGAAAWRARRAEVGPLGVTRQVAERPPSAGRALGLAAGVALFAVVAGLDRLGVGFAALPPMLLPVLLIGGFIVICAGIVIIGPWLTYHLSRVLASRAQSGAGVIAAARIRAFPAATFRSISGLVIAVFMATVFAASASGIGMLTVPPAVPGLLPEDGLVTLLRRDLTPDAARAQFAALPGVTAVVVARQVGAETTLESPVVVSVAEARALGFVDLPAGAWAAFPLANYIDSSGTTAGPASLMPAAAPAVSAPVSALFVRTDGTLVAREAARTAIQRAGVGRLPPMTRGEFSALTQNTMLVDLTALAYLGVFAAIATAGISLAVATASAMLDRKRVLGLLRLMGMPGAEIRRIAAYEAAVPLVRVLALSVGVGYLVAWVLLSALSELTLGAPDWRYFATLAASLALALAAVAATFGLINRQTGITATRFE